MEEKVSRWVKFKRYLKRTLTPTWASHFGYQCFAFIVSVLMIIGVADYAITKTYDQIELSFTDDFTVTSLSGAYNTDMNSLEFVKTAINNNAQIIELDIRQRPDDTVVMSNEIVVTNNEGVPFEDVAKLLENANVRLNLDIKETRVLDNLYIILEKYNLVERTFLTGIETINVKAVKESACADMEYYLNYMPSRVRVFFDEYREKLIDLLDETGAVGINCNYKYAGAQLSSLLHKNGYKLSVWNVNSERKINKMLAIKPNNLGTKKPEMVKKVIENWGNKNTKKS